MNCLSNIVFENLLFVDVTVGSETGVALFDSGAQKTVVSESFFRKCNSAVITEKVNAGNNNGHIMSLKKGMLKSIKIADKEVVDLEVLVIEDDMFIMEDSQGHCFEAGMLLGYDVISKFKWEYSPTMHTLDISDSNMTTKEKLVCYNEFPIVKITLSGQSYNAGIDTGHTETILGKNFESVISNLVYIEDDVVGIGTTEKVYAPMVPKLNIEYDGIEVELHNITIQEQIYGAPEEMGILLGMDFFEGKDWKLDFSTGVLRFKK